MKNKIIKTLGVGALCLAGTMAFTGCSADISESQTDRLIQISETMNDYLQEEKAKELYNGIDAYLIINRAEIMKNVTMIADGLGNGIENIIQYYVTESGTQVMISKSRTNGVLSDNYSIMYQQKNGATYEYKKDGETITKEELDDSFDEMAVRNNIFYHSIYSWMEPKEWEQGSSYSYLSDNGNYQLVFITTQDGEGSKKTTSVNYEIAPDGKLVSIRWNFVTTESNGKSKIVNAYCNFAYNTIQKSDINSILQTVIDASITE